MTAVHASLSPRGGYIIAPNLHVHLWHALAQAWRGRDDEAAEWYRRVTESGYERWSAPMEYVRSFYALGKLLEKRGDRAGARDAYRRFVAYWKGGEIDREQIAEAQTRLKLLGEG